jgi:DNA-binding beta-propeller fold protein YncE
MDTPLPLDAGLVGDASARPLAIVGDRVSDRLEMYAVTPELAPAAALSVDENTNFVDEPFDLALSRDGAVLYVVLGHADDYNAGTLSKIRLADGVKLGEVSLGEEPSMIALSSDGKRAYVTLFRNLANPRGPWTDAGALVVVDTEAMRVVGQVDVCAAALGVALDEMRGRAWVACLGAPDDKALAIVDVTSDAPRLDRVLPMAAGIGAAYVLLDEKHAFVTAQKSGELWMFDRATYAQAGRLTFATDAFPQRMALTPDRAYVLVAVDGNERIAAISTDALLEVDGVRLSGFHPQGLAVTRDGRYLLFTDEGDLVHDGRVGRIDLSGLGSGGARLDGTAPTHVFPQAIIVAE